MRNINTAVKSGIIFIKQQLRAGQYGLSCFGSDGTPRFSNDRGHLFSAFFIAEAIADELSEVERAVLLMRLLTEEHEGFWGYSPRGYYKGPEDNPHFVDADDSAFALRTYRKLKVYKSPDRLLHFYRSKWQWPGQDRWWEKGFVTFATGKRPHLVIKPCEKNNFHIHPEVNANVYHTLFDTNFEKYINFDLIARSQSPHGYWHSYFYPGKYFSTYQFLSLLSHFDKLPQSKERGIQFLQESQNDDGSWGSNSDCYETALALKCLLLYCPPNKQIHKGIEFLLKTQQTDGAWLSERIIWEFYGQNEDVWQAKDTNHIVTTSLCLSAIKNFSGAKNED